MDIRPILVRTIFVTDKLLKSTFFSKLYKPNEARRSHDASIDADYRLQLFTDDNSAPITAFMMNGMPMNVKYVNNVTSLGYATDLVQPNDRENRTGVYLRETFIVHRGHNDRYNNILDYILRTTTLDLDDDVVNKMRDYINRQNMNTAANIELNLLSHIPSALIKNHGLVYSKQHNIVFTSIDLNKTKKDVVHPFSRVNKNSESAARILNQIEPNVITLDITNNDNPNKSYFMKVGENNYKVLSSVDGVEPDGYKCNIKHNGVIVDSYEGDLDTLNELGIYDTLDACIYNGNPEMKHKFGKLEYDLEALTHAKEKLTTENDMLKLKYDAEKFKIMAEKETAIVKLNSEEKKHEDYVAKVELEMANMKDKHKMEMESIRGKAVIQQISIEKMRLENNIFVFKSKYEQKVNDIKYRRELKIGEIKHRQEMNKNNTDLFGKIVTNMLSIGKLLIK